MRTMSYKECVDYIRSDYYRITGRSNDSLVRMWMAGFLDVGFRFLFWWRLLKCNNKLWGGQDDCSPVGLMFAIRLA